jgi:putative transposase
MDKNIVFSMPKDVTHGRGYVYSLKYHIVWCNKYRKKILVNGIDEEIKEYLNHMAKEYSFSIIAMEVMPDHIHLLVDCKPQFFPSDMIKILKGNTARWLFMNHPDLKKQLWGGHLWNPSYCIVTVSDRSFDQINEYLDSQKDR